MEAIARSAEAGLVGEVGRIDHQGVAVPAPDRVAQPLADGRRRMAAVHPDDAHVVHHLRQNHHGIGRLHDLMQVVVEVGGKNRRSGSRAETEQAAFGERTNLRVVVGVRPLESRIVLAGGLVGCRPRRIVGGAAPLLRFGRQRRHAAVGRVDDEGRALLAVDRGEMRPGIEPEIVIAADISVRPRRSVAPFGRGRAVALDRCRERLGSTGDVLFELRRLWV